ncbi:hypothetical protein GV789_25835 [Nocardia cyriacigeorgica]|uniref:Uncharacterized protein n=1 Tax=Nocardia cyriacigeorgica TaxID=135487 RepID=A0A6P1DCA4_9NOCA|nr:hypothetical protein [Nocardia cyriacigeorgica]
MTRTLLRELARLRELTAGVRCELSGSLFRRLVRLRELTAGVGHELSGSLFRRLVRLRELTAGVRCELSGSLFRRLVRLRELSAGVRHELLGRLLELTGPCLGGADACELVRTEQRFVHRVHRRGIGRPGAVIRLGFRRIAR